MVGTEEEILAEYDNMVCFIAHRVYSRLSPAKRAAIDLADLQQAGRIGLLLAARSFNPELGQFKARAYVFIQRGIIELSRKMFHYRNTNQISFVNLREARYVTSSPATEPQIDCRSMLASLPSTHRDVLEQLFWEGKTMAEIGASKGRSNKWVWDIKTAAIGRLRELSTQESRAA